MYDLCLPIFTEGIEEKSKYAVVVLCTTVVPAPASGSMDREITGLGEEAVEVLLQAVSNLTAEVNTMKAKHKGKTTKRHRYDSLKLFRQRRGRCARHQEGTACSPAGAGQQKALTTMANHGRRSIVHMKIVRPQTLIASRQGAMPFRYSPFSSYTSQQIANCSYVPGYWAPKLVQS